MTGLPEYLLELAQNSGASFFRVAIGLALALLVGVVLGLARSALPAALKRNFILNFIFEAPKFPPPIAWIPFVILLLGIGEWSAYTIVFIGAVSPIFTSTFDGAEATPEVLIDSGRSFGMSWLELVYKVKFRFAMPYILTGLRIGAGMGWMSVIAAEMISGQSGLGYSIQMNRLTLGLERMIIDMIAIGLIGYLIYIVLWRLERSAIRWRARDNRA